MKFLSVCAFVGVAAAATTNVPASSERSLYVTRQGSDLKLAGKRWTMSGANVYWLGLDENVIPPPGQPFYAPFNASYPTKGRVTEIMNILNTMGARTIRSQTLGISVGNPLSLMPALGQYNEAAFESIDWAVYQAREHGIRIFAPLIDNYDYYHGGKFNFLRFRGINVDSNNLTPEVQQFYTNRTIINDFKAYLKKLITHRNKYTGLTYAEDPTIFAYETGNELGGPVFGDKDVPVSWISEITAYVKHLAPHKLLIDGTYGIAPSHLPLPTVDIYSDHFYPRNITRLSTGIAAVGAANKVYIAGEYQWGPGLGGDSLEAFFADIERRQGTYKPVIAGDQFWSLFGHDVPDCTRFVNHSSDVNTMQYGNAADGMGVREAIGVVRRHLFGMSGVRVGVEEPRVGCPGPLKGLGYD